LRPGRREAIRMELALQGTITLVELGPIHFRRGLEAKQPEVVLPEIDRRGHLRP